MLAWVPLAGAQQTYPASAVVRGENVWLRVDPAEDTEIVSLLQRGDTVTLTGDAQDADGNALYPVEVDETGWVHVLFVDPCDIMSIGEAPSIQLRRWKPMELPGLL